MGQAVLGLTFSETMAGGFALGERDPVAGEKRGRAAGTELAMHATIHLSDVRRFAADPAHAGTLTGHIDFPPLGMHLPATGGVFNLFSPGGQPTLKLMVYELAFTHKGKPYYLAGKKEVRDDPGFDVWSDTTTLYTTLHEGGKDGPIVGAGVLHLGIKDLANLVSTMRATGADGLRENAEAIGIFGRLFLGELWDSYARMAGQ
jgi:cholesterol oxidase